MAVMINDGFAHATTPIERSPMNGASTFTNGASTFTGGTGGPQMFDNQEKAGASGTQMAGASGTQMAGGSGTQMAGGMRTQMNGGGPEPQVPGSQNPGGQTDTGGLGTKYFEQPRGHMGGDDGVQNAVEKPTPMRMGGIQGAPPNAGQRGGQNTGTSGNRSSSMRGGTQAGGATGARPMGATGADTMGGSQQWGSGGTQQDTATSGTLGEGPSATGARSSNPVGFASGIGHDARSAQSGATAAHGGGRPHEAATGTHHDAATASYAADSPRWNGREAEATSLDRSRKGETLDGKMENAKMKAKDMATDAKRKSEGFMANAKNKLEEFFDSDIDGDGHVGARGIGGGSEGEPYGDSSTGTYPYDARAKTAAPTAGGRTGASAKAGGGTAGSPQEVGPAASGARSRTQPEARELSVA